MSLRIFLVFPILLVAAEGQCPSSCKCPSSHTAHCSSAGLTEIPSERFDIHLRYLNISNNSLEALYKSTLRDIKVVSLVELDASANVIRYVDREAFIRHSKLERLDLSSNLINRIDPNTFKYNLHLKWLSLSRNQLSERLPTLHSTSLTILLLSSCGLDSVPSTTFSKLPGLQEIYLPHNKIETLDSLKGIQNLKVLDLSNNHLTSLNANLVDELPGLTKLNLRNNWMISLSIEVVKKLVNITESRDLEGNPWDCDCFMFNTIYSWCRENYQKLNIMCSSPQKLKGKLWTAYEEIGCQEIGYEETEEIVEIVEVLNMSSGFRKSENMKMMEKFEVYPRRMMKLSGFEVDYLKSSMILGVLCLILMAVAGFLWYKYTSRNSLRSGPPRNASEKDNLRRNNA